MPTKLHLQSELGVGWGEFRYNVSTLGLVLNCGPESPRHRYRRIVKTTQRRQPEPRRYWSQHATETSNALDLESGVFSKSSPRAIARSLKRSAEMSTRRKGGAYQSAMSMLSFYINRAGRNLSPARRRILERAKNELRTAFGRA